MAAQPEVVSQAIKPQSQEVQPGLEFKMDPRPQSIRPSYKGARKLAGKVAVITGGDSGIGRAIAIHFARESAAGIAILYKDEAKDAQETVTQVNAEGCPSCLAIAGDIGDAQRGPSQKHTSQACCSFGSTATANLIAAKLLPCPHCISPSFAQVCEDAIASVVKEFGGLDVLVLNAAEQVRRSFREEKGELH
ncbi:hypothetical protein DUNSADRAFT_417 [Dunaliella salina]|uniref:Uncharacterized protein n=1 Tax=Dunaliella salina TaxID=3046 RepID=A0ABQ7FZ06_DUNSA|nr:hypothetical protein DUNSADRAFT_417 [Dunaliella salina]|eukprot:KAF5827575.1 hypothetical protein DUNSADRAFT_417 [Dunaliella salina]